MKTILSALLVFYWIATLPVEAGGPIVWVTQQKAELRAARVADGDSFGMTVASPTAKRVKLTY